MFPDKNTGIAGSVFVCVLLDDMGVSKNRGGPPKSSHFNRVFHYKPSILGYPYFLETTIQYSYSLPKNPMSGPYDVGSYRCLVAG